MIDPCVQTAAAASSSWATHLQRPPARLANPHPRAAPNKQAEVSAGGGSGDVKEPLLIPASLCVHLHVCLFFILLLPLPWVMGPKPQGMCPLLSELPKHSYHLLKCQILFCFVFTLFTFIYIVYIHAVV